MKNFKLISLTVLITLCVIVSIGFLTHEKKEFISDRKITGKAFIENKTFDFGKLSYKKTAKNTFVIKNIGETPLILKNVIPSCNCTSVKYDKNIVPARGLVNIDVEYFPEKNKLGKKKSIIFIESNFDKNITELVIQGIVTK